MKSARQMAQIAISVNRDGNALDRLERLFKEHAIDQRHIIAELEFANDGLPVNRSDAHQIAINAPAPGEGR